VSHARRIALTLAAATGTVVGGGLAVHASGVVGNGEPTTTSASGSAAPGTPAADATSQQSGTAGDREELAALVALEDELRRRLDRTGPVDRAADPQPVVARADDRSSPPTAHVATGASGALGDDDEDDDDSGGDDSDGGGDSTRSRETPSFSTVSRDTATRGTSHDG
jgi:hypothetical protein